MKYSIHGPFEIKRKKGLVDRGKEAKRCFWDAIEEKESFLPYACGCYVFAIRASMGIKPWYVGLSEKQIFKNECFKEQKINIYNDVLAQCGNGTPIVFLIAKRTKGGKFNKPGKNGYRDIRYLETLLIGTSIEKNPDLMNIKKTKYMKEMCVPGLINSPKKKPSKSEAAFRKTIKK